MLYSLFLMKENQQMDTISTVSVQSYKINVESTAQILALKIDIGLSS